MKSFEFKNITINDIPSMADLLMARQESESSKFTFLKNSCLNVKFIRDSLAKLFTQSKVMGIGAFVNGELVGYILGELKLDNRRGRHAWVPYQGIAIRRDQSSELIRHLYAKASVLWLEQGCFTHYTLIPMANQMYYEALLQLSFAMEQVHGVMKIEEYQPFGNVANVSIRVANNMDSEVMGKMSGIISSYQNSTPVFIPALPEVVASIKNAFKRAVNEDDVIILIAENGKMEELGFQEYEFISPNLMSPDNGIELCTAGTYYSQMGKGIGKKLMNEGCRILKEKGYGYIITDWRITNLASSTFWPKCGFNPVAYRMVRYIDSNYAWANLNNLTNTN